MVLSSVRELRARCCLTTFDNSRDVAKWNFGVVNRPARAFDPLVQVQEQNQRLEITPRALMGGLPIGNLSLYQTSSDGIAWVTQRTVAVGVPLTALKIELSAGTYNFVSPTGTAIFDNFVLETPGVTALVRPLLFGRDLQAGSRDGREPAEPLESRPLWWRLMVAGTGG